MQNYLAKRKVMYSVQLKNEKNKFIRIYEHIDGFNKEIKSPMAIIFSWRADLVHKFVNRIYPSYNDKNNLYEPVRPISDNMSIFDFDDKCSSVSSIEWNNEYSICPEVAMKALFAMKMLSSMDDRLKIDDILEKIELTNDDEIRFWVWKVLNYENKALSSYRTMYL